MGGGLLAVCDPVLLGQAWKSHRLTEPGTLGVKVPGRKLRIGGNPGLTQVLPADGIGSLGVPAKVVVQGTASDRAYLYLRALSVEPEHWASGEALFRGLGLADGGTATLDVRLSEGKVVFRLHRPDGSALQPLRWSHLEGPGATSQLSRLPEHYADTPQQGVRTYVAALTARDGKTICRLWTADVGRRFAANGSPCWVTVTGLIDYAGESDSPIFDRAEILDVGDTSERSRYGVSFTAVPVTIRSRYRTSRYSSGIETRTRVETIWFRKIAEGWRIAKDPLSAGSEEASVPPDPYAELHAREAREKEAAARSAARRRSLIRLAGALSCPHGLVIARDPVGDVQLTSPHRGHAAGALRGSADIVRASVAMTGRRVCFATTFAGRPLGGKESIGLTVLYTPLDESQRAYATFQLESADDGLHAGVADSSSASGTVVPAGARAAVNGKTVRASFTLPPSFPTLRRDAFSRLGIRVSTSARASTGPTAAAWDQAEGGVTPEKVAHEAAKAAQAREARQKAAAWAPALVHYGRGGVRCRGKSATAIDHAGDARVIQTGARQAMEAMGDIRSATVRVAGRHVCLSVTFARQPFGRPQRRYSLEFGLGLTYRTKAKPYLQRAGFGVMTNAYLRNGLTYAGFHLGGTPATRSNAHAELHGNTLKVDFDLEPTFPYLRSRDLTHFSWGLGIFVTDLNVVRSGGGHPQVHDQLPNNPDRTGNSISPEVRQSDGHVITPY